MKFTWYHWTVRNVAMRGLQLNDQMSMAVTVRTNGIPKPSPRNRPPLHIRVDEDGEYIYIDKKRYLKDMVQQEEEL